MLFQQFHLYEKPVQGLRLKEEKKSSAATVLEPMISNLRARCQWGSNFVLTAKHRGNRKEVVGSNPSVVRSFFVAEKFFSKRENASFRVFMG